MSYYDVGHSTEIIARESYGEPIAGHGKALQTVRPQSVGVDWGSALETAGKVGSAIVDYGPQAWDAVKKYGPQAVSLVKQYGPQAATLIKKYGPQAIGYLKKYGPRAAAALAAAKGGGRVAPGPMMPAQEGFFDKNKVLILGGGAAIVLLLILMRKK